MSFHTFSRTEPTFRKSQENWETEGDLNGDGVKNMEDLKLTTKEIELYFEEDPSRPDGNCFYHSMVDYIEGNDTEIYNTIFETPAYLEEWIKQHALYEANSKVGFKEEEMFMMHWLRSLVCDESLKPTNNEKNGNATSDSTIELRKRLLEGKEQTKSDQNKSHGHVGTDLWTMDREIDLTARFLKIDICTFQRIGGKDEWIMSLYDTAKDVLDGPICFLKNNGVHFTNLKFKGKAKLNAKDAEVANLKMANLLKEARDRKKSRKAEKARKEAERKKDTSNNDRKEAWVELPKEIPKKTVKNLVQEVNAVDGLMELVNQNDDEILNLIEQQEKTNKEKIRKLELAQQRLNNWDGNSDEINEIKLIISLEDIDVNELDDWYRTPLWIACERGHVDVMRLLLAREEIDVNQADRWDRTPLWIACENGHVDVVRLLLARKDIDVNQADGEGATPLYITCQNGHVDVVRLLLARKEIQINQADEGGKTPLYITCQEGHVDVVRHLLARDDIDVNQSDNKKGETPFFRACRFGHVNVVRLLLDMSGININQLTSKDNKATSLYIACQNGHADVVKLLLTHKDIDVNIPLNTNGASPLYIACGMGHADVVQLLLAREEIDVNQVANDGTTPLQIAQLEKQTEIVALLSKSKKK
jgi:ankyrin repeat protein